MNLNKVIAQKIQSFINPFSIAVKKYLYDVLQERYGGNEDIIDRITVSLITENDIQGFAKLVSCIYEAGYFKAVEEHRDVLGRLGHHVRIVPSTPEVQEKDKIFNQKSQEQH
jgi:hypothetical protein